MKTINYIACPKYPHQRLLNKALSSGFRGEYASAAQLLVDAWLAGSLQVMELFDENYILPAEFQTNLGQIAEEIDDYTKGLMFLFGCGAKRNNTSALNYFKLAAEQGHVIAQNILALMYEDGCGVGGQSEENDLEALRLYQLAAEQGCSVAQNNLAKMYQKGRGVGAQSEENDLEAVRLYQLAVQQGNVFAQNNLGFMYQKGRGAGGKSEENDREAVRLYRLAAEEGYAVAQNNLAFMYEKNRGVGTARNANAREAVRLYQLAVQQGDANAACNLAIFFSEKDKDALALSWYGYAGVLYAIQDKEKDVSYVIKKIYRLGVGKEKRHYALRQILTATVKDSELALMANIEKFSNASEYQYFAMHDIKRFSSSHTCHRTILHCCEKWCKQLNEKFEVSEVEALIRILTASSVEQLNVMHQTSVELTSDNWPMSLDELTKLPYFHMFLSNLDSTDIEDFKSIVFHLLTATLVSGDYKEKLQLLKMTSKLMQHNTIVTQDVSLNRLLVNALISVCSQGSIAPNVEPQFLEVEKLDVLISLVLTMETPIRILEEGDELCATNIALGQQGLKLMETYGILLPAPPTKKHLLDRGDESSKNTKVKRKSSMKHHFFEEAESEGSEYKPYGYDCTKEKTSGIN